MFRIILFVILVSGGAVFGSDFRTFTDTQGREVRAKLVKVDARSGKITLERENRKRSTVPANLFSAEDQAYIKEWLLAQDFLSNSKLRISVTKRKGKAAQKRSEMNRPKAPEYFTIMMDNRSPVAFNGLSVEYCIYKKTEIMKGNRVTLSVVNKKETVELSAGKKCELETAQVKLFRKYSAQTEVSYDSRGYHDVSTSYNKVSEDDVEGIWIRVKYSSAQGHTFVRDICWPESVKDKYQWNSDLI